MEPLLFYVSGVIIICITLAIYLTIALSRMKNVSKLRTMLNATTKELNSHDEYIYVEVENFDGKIVGLALTKNNYTLLRTRADKNDDELTSDNPPSYWNDLKAK
jgi:cell shape-determining protein MreC